MARSIIGKHKTKILLFFLLIMSFVCSAQSASESTMEFFSIVKNNGCKNTTTRSVSKYQIQKLFFDPETDINYQDKLGRTALHWALINENYFIIELILNNPKEKNLDVNLIDVDGNTPLHLALEKYNYALIEILLNCGANPLLCSDNKSTPLWYALQYSKERIRTFVLFKT
jgi:ankyrin repeat protein